MSADKVVVVTGGTRGLGRQISLDLAKNGYRVLSLYNREQASAEALLVEAKSNHLDIQISKVNLAKPEEILQFCESLKNVPVYGLINNASPYYEPKTFSKISPEELENMWQVIVRAAFLLSQNLHKNMKALGTGRIVNILTEGTLDPVTTGGGAYIVAKYALLGLTKLLSVELARYKICVNAISPGMLDVGMAQAWPDHLKEALSLKPATKSKQVSELVRFLCSPDAQNRTGENLDVSLA